MKNFFKPTHIPLLTLLCGAIGLLLRVWLFAAGIDEKGLLISSHPANTLVFVLTAVFMALLLLAVRPLHSVANYRILFPASPLPILGCAAAAVGVLLSAFREISMRRDPVTIVTLILAAVAAVCLLLRARCRFKGTRPHYLLQTALTVYLMLHLISQYRLWSAEPQLQQYFFQLLASVLLMLTAYHGTMLDAKRASRRWFVFCNQAALFCCCLSLNSESWLFYLTMGIFTATTLCSLQVTDPKPHQEV